jgi:hypothetical protein
VKIKTRKVWAGTTPAHVVRLTLLGCKELVDLFNKRICVGSVNGTSRLNRLSARRGASEAMHTDCKEELCGFYVVIENITDNRLLCNNHDKTLSLLDIGNRFSEVFNPLLLLYPIQGVLSIGPTIFS